MAANRRQVLLLGSLLVLLAAVLWFEWPRAQTGKAMGVPAERPATARPAPSEPDRQVADVGLVQLSDPQPAPVDSGRNPFRFAAPRPDPSMQELPPHPVDAFPEAVPLPPPGPPPIPLKFIGMVDGSAQTARLAVLSDGRNVFHGREGDIIDGRYRIVRIGVESIEMSYLDGGGRQTIRLSGAG